MKKSESGFNFIPLVIAGFVFSGLVGAGVYMFNKK